jgi:hypothetical protein
MTIEERDREFADLRRQVRALRTAVGVIGVGFIAVTATAFRSKDADVLRARGLIIVDDAGRDRILLGAPIPFTASRVRTDTLRVARDWAPGFPDSTKYMGYYRRYRHSMHGLLVLDENGFDRVAIGDSTPDPNIGRRIGASTGVVVNDARGFERTGYGMLTVDGTDRVVLGLDSKHGTEGMALSIIDGGDAGLTVFGSRERRMFLGIAAPDSSLGLRDTTRGLLLTNRSRVVHRLTTEGAVRK